MSRLDRYAIMDRFARVAGQRARLDRRSPREPASGGSDRGETLSRRVWLETWQCGARGWFLDLVMPFALLLMLMPAAADGAELSTALAAPATFTLRIDAETRTGFSADCILLDRGDPDPIRLNGVTPLRHQFLGEQLICRIAPRGDGGTLAVELASTTGEVSRSRPQGRAGAVTMAVR